MIFFTVLAVFNYLSIDFHSISIDFKRNSISIDSNGILIRFQLILKAC